MSLLTKAASLVYKMTPLRKAALAKAVRASALKRKGKSLAKGAVASKLKGRAKAAAIHKATGAKAAVKLKAIKSASGKARTKLRKASYKERLKASRAEYKSQSFKTKLVRNLKAGGINRNYAYMTTGENFKRNLARKAKVTAVAATAAAGYTTVSNRNKNKAKKATKSNTSRRI